MRNHLDAARTMADECLCFRVRRVSRVLTRLYDEPLRPLGIQATQLTLLNAVALCGAAATMGRLSEILAMDTTTLSRNLRPLEQSGLVAVERSAADRRVRVAVLTAAGERMIEEALPLWKAAHERIVALLGEAAAELRDGFDGAVHAVRCGAERVVREVAKPA